MFLLFQNFSFRNNLYKTFFLLKLNTLELIFRKTFHAIQLFGLARAHANQLLCNNPNLLKQAIKIRLEIGIISPNYNYKGKPFVVMLYLIIYFFLIIFLFHLKILIYLFHYFILFFQFNMFYQIILFQIIIYIIIILN